MKYPGIDMRSKDSKLFDRFVGNKTPAMNRKIFSKQNASQEGEVLQI